MRTLPSVGGVEVTNMRLACVSASNIRHSGANSTSLKTCELIAQIASERLPGQVTTEVLALVELELKPCIGCGHCYHTSLCAHDDVFNDAFSTICNNDALFIVSPHYAPIPAKLCMLLEKIEQMAFLPRFHDDKKHSPLWKKPIGIVAHGGGTEEHNDLYRVPVIEAIANALSWPVEANVVLDPKLSLPGATFQVSKVECAPDVVFPIQTYDWNDIRDRITPIVLAVLAAASELAAGEPHGNP
jgi:hypothetical protein